MSVEKVWVLSLLTLVSLTWVGCMAAAAVMLWRGKP